MNVIIFEENAYYEHLREITRYIQEHIIEPEWLSQEDALKKLNISLRTLKRYRDCGFIEYSEISERVFLYNNASINKFIEMRKKRIGGRA